MISQAMFSVFVLIGILLKSPFTIAYFWLTKERRLELKTILVFMLKFCPDLPITAKQLVQIWLLGVVIVYSLLGFALYAALRYVI